MTIKRRRERDRERMRRRILDAAKTLFGKERYENVSIRSIAAAIDYSPAAIYRYFKNKKEIFSILRDEGFQRFVVGQKQRVEEYADPVERMRIGARSFVQFALAEPEYYRLMFRAKCDEVHLDGEWCINSMDSFNIFRNNIKECINNGHFGDVDVDTATFTVWANLQGIVHLIHSGRASAMFSGLDLDQLVESAIGFQLRSGNKKQ